MSDKKPTDEDFRRLLARQCCSCKDPRCKNLLKEYYFNESSIYPNGERKLLFMLNNPSKAAGATTKRHTRQQQLYDRAAMLLKVEDYQELRFIRIGITHYHSTIIDHYNRDRSDEKAKHFPPYLLPSILVSNAKLGVKFTSVDRFDCLGTTMKGKDCKGNCICNRYLNAPFVTVATNEIVDTGSDRSKRKQAFTDTRNNEMAPAEVEILANRADCLKATIDVLETEKKEQEGLLTKSTSELESVRKELTYAKKVGSPLKREVSSLKEENEALLLENEKLSEQKERSDKKARKHYDKNRRSDSPFDAGGTTSEDELKRLGLCRQSLLDKEWHALNPTASRSLLNFESFDECIGYIGVLFPELRSEIASLKEKGAQQYVRRSTLTPLEKCMLCRLSPKTDLHDMQIGFIYGIKRPAVSKIKKIWMPRWGYAGKMLTDLDLYEDYIENERPDAYYQNELPDIGTQCDGKDFLCQSFRRSSSLNRAQHSSKMKAAALRCITWSSLCGLVWAFTPLVLARYTENSLVQWYGDFEGGEKYVPISRSDWDESTEEDDKDCSDDDGDGDENVDDGNGSDGIDDTEETLVVSIASVHDNVHNIMEQSDDEEDQEDDDNDERIRECYDDMDDGSLSGCSDNESDDGAFERGDDGCISLDKELEKFDQELLGKSKEKKLVSKDLLRVHEIKAMAKEVLESGPDRNGRTKLEQLEMLQELHVEYEAGRMKKCLLSMYLKLTLHHRKKIIEQLKMYRDGKLNEPPRIPRRLAKLLSNLKVLADRGFDGDNLSYPHFNMVVTPEFYDKESKQFDISQLERDRKICELRYTCEVVFSRVTTEKMMSGVIPYSVFAHIEHAHCWAHAQANLRQPLQMPGSNALDILGQSYFDNDN